LLGVFGFVRWFSEHTRDAGRAGGEQSKTIFPGPAAGADRGLLQSPKLANTAPESSDRQLAVITRPPSGSGIRRAVTSGAVSGGGRRIQVLSRSGDGPRSF